MLGQVFNGPCSNIIRSALPRVVLKIHVILTDSVRVLTRNGRAFSADRS